MKGTDLKNAIHNIRLPEESKERIIRNLEQINSDTQEQTHPEAYDFEVAPAKTPVLRYTMTAVAACAVLAFTAVGVYAFNKGEFSPVSDVSQPTDVISSENTAVQPTEEAPADEINDSGEYEVPDSSDGLTQFELYYRCMNTLEFLDRISGNVTLSQSNRFEEITVGSFEFDFTADQYHAIVGYELDGDPSISQKKTEHFNQAGHCIKLYDYMTDIPYEYTERFHGPTMEGMVWSDKANIYNTYGKDPTYAHELGACFIPQEMSLGYLEDFDHWEIVEKVDWNGRVCYHIQGVGGEYGSGFGVDTFHIWVDGETGIWYQYEGYNAAGELTDYMYTENIQFGDAAKEVIAFSEEMAEGYEYHFMDNSAFRDPMQKYVIFLNSYNKTHAEELYFPTEKEFLEAGTTVSECLEFFETEFPDEESFLQYVEILAEKGETVISNFHRTNLYSEAGKGTEVIGHYYYFYNASGQTYGSNGVNGLKPEDEPDLISVLTDEGRMKDDRSLTGYIKKEDCNEEPPSSPEKAVHMTEEREKAIENGTYSPKVSPVYDSDGKTVIGTFTSGN